MEVIWPTEIATSWVEVVSWGCGILLGAFGTFRGLYLFRQSNKIRRSELLKSLLDEYYDDSVASSIRAIDSDQVVFTDGSIVLTEKDKNSVRLSDSALLFFSNVCYLRQQGLISSKEFDFFRWKIQSVLERPSIVAYINSCVSQDDLSPYKRLLRYKKTETCLHGILRIFQGGGKEK